MQRPARVVTVHFRYPRQVIWELKNHYDPSTVEDILRIEYCSRVMLVAILGCVFDCIAYVTFRWAYALWFGHISGQAYWTALALLALTLSMRTFRWLLPHYRAQEAIEKSDAAKFKRIAREMVPLRALFNGSTLENVVVSLRL